MNRNTLVGPIPVLLDSSAESGDRDDAAMALGLREDQEAEEALLAVASDISTDPDLADRCGESLAQIWSRRGGADVETINKLTGVARRVALATINALSPSLSKRITQQGVHTD